MCKSKLHNYCVKVLNNSIVWPCLSPTAAGAGHYLSAIHGVDAVVGGIEVECQRVGAATQAGFRHLDPAVEASGA